MSTPRRLTAAAVLLALACVCRPCWAAEERPYPQATHGKGQLRHIGGLPVLVLQGTPEEIGRQEAALCGKVAQQLTAYPRALLMVMGAGDRWPRLQERAGELLKQFPADHRRELEAMADAVGVDRQMMVAANTLVDIYRGGLGCSSLMVDPGQSATGGPLFGRNLDFHSLGVIHKLTLVKVVRPDGKRAFASIGFPGLVGCLSGINDAGLAVAVHEVYRSRDDSPMFDRGGVPYTLCFRRILEECSTVEEAAKLLRSVRRTTKLNLALCDRRGGAVLEMTPESVVLRRGVEGITACTNHFRSDTLAVNRSCRRYEKLIAAREMPPLGVADVAAKLHEVNQGRLTLHTMIFEPSALRLHLAFGKCPSSALPTVALDLAPLLGVEPPAQPPSKFSGKKASR